MQKYLLIVGIMCIVAALPWRRFLSTYLYSKSRNSRRIIIAQVQDFATAHAIRTGRGHGRFKGFGLHSGDELFANEVHRMVAGTPVESEVMSWLWKNWQHRRFDIKDFKISETPSPTQFESVEYRTEEWVFDKNPVG